MVKPVVSICLTSYRPNGVLRLYQSIGQSTVPFEIIAVGPNLPTHWLPPDNMKFIASDVKPAQCFEIACREAQGECILHVADDWRFRRERPLDALYQLWNEHNNPKLLLSCSLAINGVDQSPACHYAVLSDTSSPLVSIGTWMSKTFLQELGGVDRRFIAAFWDIDIVYRAHEQGGTVVLTDVWVDEESTPAQGPPRCGPFWSADRRLLNRLWGFDRPSAKIIPKRADRVQSYREYRIQLASQGPRGRWVGPHPRMESAIDYVRNRARSLINNSL